MNRHRAHNPRPQPRHTLRVVDTADRGMGLGHLEGKVVFVPWSAPGDLVEVALVRDKRRYAEARLLRVLEPSPLRRPPACPVFGRCGGCQWQHLPYSAQLDAKARGFQSLLQTRLKLPAACFRAPLPAPHEWGYRNRAGLKVRVASNAVQVGFFARGSHRLVPIQDCPILAPGLRRELGPLRQFLQGFHPARDRRLPQIDLQLDDAGGVWAVLHLLVAPTAADNGALERFVDAQGWAGVHLQSGRKATLRPLTGAPGEMPFHVPTGARELELRVRPGGFVQANPLVNRALVEQVLAIAEARLPPTGRVLELFSGAGNFTLPLATLAATVVAVEGYPPAAEDAQRNAQRLGFPGIRVHAGDVAAVLAELGRATWRPDLVLLDPPRDGCGEVLADLAALQPPAILYVSCSPPSLVRDLGRLQGLGYRVARTGIADMFPQTAHVESLTRLARRL